MNIGNEKRRRGRHPHRPPAAAIRVEGSVIEPARKEPDPPDPALCPACGRRLVYPSLLEGGEPLRVLWHRCRGGRG